jgi:predicted MFS family arabinose efflux permease
VGRLWRHGDFIRLWAGETVEWLTGSVTNLAVPTIAILIFNADPFEMGLLTSLTYVAFPFLAPFAGVLVDRWRRRPVLIWTNIIQFAALGSIPAAFLLRALSLYQLFIVTLVMSVTIVFFSLAYTSYLPTLIGREDLVEGNSKLETSASGTGVVGPAIAGGLIQILGAAPAVAVDAFGTLFAAIAILSIKKPEPPPSLNGERHFWRELRDGVRSVAENASLRNLATTTSILNIGNGMFLAVLYLFIYDQLKISVEVAGITIAVGGMGFVIGAVSGPTLLKRIGLGSTLTLALLLNGLGLLAIQTSIHGPGPILLAGFWFLANMGLPIYNINQVSFRQTIVADKLQGRMNATMRTFGYGALTVGALIGGIIASQYGILSVMTVGPLIALLSTPMLYFGPIGKLKQIPQTPT